MTNAQKVFDLAMALMDEINERGQADNADTKEYKNRTLGILNVLRGELTPYSDDTYPDPNKDLKANLRRIIPPLEKFEEPIQLDDYLCQSVMPYGLAAHLLLDENPSAAAFFQQKYDELKADAAKGMSGYSEDIIDVYGGCWAHNDFGRW